MNRQYKVSCEGCNTDTLTGGFTCNASDACKNYMTVHLPDYQFIGGHCSGYEDTGPLWRFEAVHAGLVKIIWVRELKA